MNEDGLYHLGPAVAFFGMTRNGVDQLIVTARLCRQNCTRKRVPGAHAVSALTVTAFSVLLYLEELAHIVQQSPGSQAVEVPVHPR